MTRLRSLSTALALISASVFAMAIDLARRWVT